jgi:hypothetical protein
LLFRERNERIVFFTFEQQVSSREEVMSAYESVAKEAGTAKSDEDFGQETGDLDRQAIWWEDAEDERGVETIGAFQFDSRHGSGTIKVSRTLVSD